MQGADGVTAGTAFALLHGGGQGSWVWAPTVQGASDSELGWPVDPATHSPEQRYRAMVCNDMAGAEASDFLARLGPDVWPTDTFMRSDWRYDHLARVPVSYVVLDRDQALPPVWQERFAARIHAGCRAAAALPAACPWPRRFRSPDHPPGTRLGAECCPG